MKHKLCITLLLFSMGMGIGIEQAHAQTLLDIRKTDGTVKSISLSTLNKITFSDVDLTLNYSIGGNESFLFSSIRKIIFSKTTGIKPLNADQEILSVYPNPATSYIILKNVPGGDLNASIYNVAGTLVLNLHLDADSRQIDISHLPKGLYLIQVNNQAQKFSIQ